MKNILAASIISLLFLSACDQCKDVNCLNGGVCVEGTCDCPTGFSGALCSFEDVCLSGSLECQNDGECVDGECDCGTWYDGDECEDKVIEEYEGVYDGEFACFYTNESFVSLEDISSEDNEMTLTEQSGREYDIVFSNSRDFEIETQTVTDGNQFTGAHTVSGDGEVNGDALSFTVTYTYSGQGSSTTCLFTGEK